jgi:hypothetical protein
MENIYGQPYISVSHWHYLPPTLHRSELPTSISAISPLTLGFHSPHRVGWPLRGPQRLLTHPYLHTHESRCINIQQNHHTTWLPTKSTRSPYLIFWLCSQVCFHACNILTLIGRFRPPWKIQWKTFATSGWQLSLMIILPSPQWYSLQGVQRSHNLSCSTVNIVPKQREQWIGVQPLKARANVVYW